MVRRSDPTAAQVDELLRYLPDVEASEKRFDALLQTPASRPNVSVGFDYPGWLNRFFELTAQPQWADDDYDPASTSLLIQDDAVVSSASMAEIRSMLTLCTRGERFCDGHWAAMIREGRISALLRRLLELKVSPPEDRV